MPLIDKPLAELRTYQCINPRPDDFDPFWGEALAEMDAQDSAVELLEFSRKFQELAADLPATIDLQREAIVGDVDRQRVETLRDFERMRRAIFEDTARERQAVLSELARQLQVALVALGNERASLTGDLPAVAGRAGEALLPAARVVIDHAFWRVVQLLILLFVLVAAAIGLFRWMHARPRQ